jgi:uncharacterized protein (TIGR03382 family)
LDLDPNRPGIQVQPGNYPVHMNVDAVTGSRSLLDFSSLPGFGQMASPFRDDMTRTSSFFVASGADVRFNETLANDGSSWAGWDGTPLKTLGQVPVDRLLSFTNADIGKTFTVEFDATLRHMGYDADGNFAGSVSLGDYAQSYSIEVIPAPGSLCLGVLGSLGLLRRRRATRGSSTTSVPGAGTTTSSSRSDR